MIEVTDKTDSNTLFISPILRRSSAMGAGLLVSPAESHFNLAVAAVCAIADDKIVAHTIPMVFLSVHSVKDSRIPVFSRGMMDHNRRPVFLQTGWR